MGEKHPEAANPVHVGLAMDYYEAYVRARSLGVKTPEAKEAYDRYKTYRDSLGPEEQSLIDDRIVRLERPDLAEKTEASPPPEPVGEDPNIARWGKQVDDRLVIDAAERIVKQAKAKDKEK